MTEEEINIKYKRDMRRLDTVFAGGLILGLMASHVFAFWFVKLLEWL